MPNLCYIDGNLGIQTRHGTAGFHYEDSSEDMAKKMDLMSICHSLAGTNRYFNHTYVPISVAQHCYFTYVLVIDKHYKDNDLCLAAAMHDFEEAYTGDIGGPLKAYLDSDKLRELIKRIERGVEIHFSLPPGILNHQIVKEYDLQALKVERALLLPAEPRWNKDGDYSPTAKETSILASTLEMFQGPTGWHQFYLWVSRLLKDRN